MKAVARLHQEIKRKNKEGTESRLSGDDLSAG